MKISVSELAVVFPDVVVEKDGVKLIDIDALKAKLDRLESAGVKVAILPDGPPPTGK